MQRSTCATASTSPTAQQLPPPASSASHPRRQPARSARRSPPASPTSSYIPSRSSEPSRFLPSPSRPFGLSRTSFARPGARRPWCAGRVFPSLASSPILADAPGIDCARRLADNRNASPALSPRDLGRALRTAFPGPRRRAWCFAARFSASARPSGRRMPRPDPPRRGRRPSAAGGWRIRSRRPCRAPAPPPA